MSHDLSSSFPSLTGQLLLAVPSMRDPNFSRTVVLMAAHSSQEGAFGYILNRPLEQKVGELMPDADLGPLAQAPVYVGGPVSADKLAFASLSWNRSRSTVRLQTHLSMTDAQHALSMGRDVRGFVGYSGWGEGQLEKEIEHRTWITISPVKNILTTQQPANLWGDILESMGPLFGLMAKIPENVELN